MTTQTALAAELAALETDRDPAEWIATYTPDDTEPERISA